MLYLDELTPVLEDPRFDPSLVIMILDLPLLGTRDCSAVPLERVVQVIGEVTTKAIRRGDLRRWKRELDNVIAQGLTAVVKLYGVDRKAWIEVHGVEIRATAQA